MQIFKLSLIFYFVEVEIFGAKSLGQKQLRGRMKQDLFKESSFVFNIGSKNFYGKLAYQGKGNLGMAK